MAWMRTAVSLLGFGFSIYKFFEYLHGAGLTEPDWTPHAPRLLAIALISLGSASLLLAMINHVKVGRILAREVDRRFSFDLTFVASAVLLVLGLAALWVVAFRTGPL